MIYISLLDKYTDEAYRAHLLSLPLWRKEKALQYAKFDDRKRSVLAFTLLQRALLKEYGIIEIPKFAYNEFGKPFLPNLPIHFSLSHCKEAVACAVSDHNVGIDVESIIPYAPSVAMRVCTTTEFEMLAYSDNKDVDFIKLWTVKEAISKYEGKGLSLPFSEIKTENYTTASQILNNSKCVISVCYGCLEIV